MLLFINLYTDVMLVIPKSKTSPEFFSTFNFTTKFWKVGEIWVVDARYLWFVYLFLFSLSDHNIWHHFLCFAVYLLTVAIIVLGKVLLVLIPWVKVWYLLFAYIVIKLGQSIREWNLEAAEIPQKIGQKNHTMSSLNHFDLENIYYR